MGKFFKVYIELTNICGLKCSFCPPKTRPVKTLSLEEFEHVLKEVKPHTDDIALHVVGDPLVAGNLKEYLDLVQKHKLKAHITTSGYHLAKEKFHTLIHPCLWQINFSLNSFNKNDLSVTFEEYLGTIVEFCKYKNLHRRDLFVNLRLWNMDSQNSEDEYNKIVFERLQKDFSFDLGQCDYKKPLRIDNKVLIHFDKYFQWPSLKLKEETNGYCHGLSSQIAILADGTVVPCCLDCDGIIDLGNIYEQTLEEILSSSRAVNIINGFKQGIAVEELCKKCTYKKRFDR